MASLTKGFFDCPHCGSSNTDYDGAEEKYYCYNCCKYFGLK